MQTISLDAQWFARLLPEGLPVKTSTLLSGPGGTGKPLVGEHFMASWLRAGGSVVSMPLQYPDTEFMRTSLQTVTDVDLNEYSGQTAFLSLDGTIEGMEEPEGNVIRANLAKPDVWDAALDRACDMIPDTGPGIMVFASALNLLLFSPTYGQLILEKMKSFLQDDTQYTRVCSVSTSAKKKQIASLEDVTDNLILTRSEDHPFRMYMRIMRMKDVPFVGEEVRVPIPPESLEHLKDIAENSRKRVIPQMMAI